MGRLVEIGEQCLYCMVEHLRRRPSTAPQEETKCAAAGRSTSEDKPGLAIQGSAAGSRRPSAAQQPPDLAPPHHGQAAADGATTGASPSQRPSSFAIDCATSLPNSPAIKLPPLLKLPTTGKFLDTGRGDRGFLGP